MAQQLPQVVCTAAPVDQHGPGSGDISWELGLAANTYEASRRFLPCFPAEKSSPEPKN